MRGTIAGALALVLLAACTARVTPPRVEVESRPVVAIKVGDSGRFCPPGQAKKGNC